ncbi:hypothetical protein HBB16_14170 [Pseudonocardia sp. MCCB 268]|nr:hypothetical protein [Pseudonocardia cytotoxica]
MLPAPAAPCRSAEQARLTPPTGLAVCGPGGWTFPTPGSAASTLYTPGFVTPSPGRFWRRPRRLAHLGSRPLPTGCGVRGGWCHAIPVVRAPPIRRTWPNCRPTPRGRPATAPLSGEIARPAVPWPPADGPPPGLASERAIGAAPPLPTRSGRPHQGAAASLVEPTWRPDPARPRADRRAPRARATPSPPTGGHPAPGPHDRPRTAALGTGPHEPRPAGTCVRPSRPKPPTGGHPRACATRPACDRRVPAAALHARPNDRREPHA